jgi:protein-ribulosamine 3-kinase
MLSDELKYNIESESGGRIVEVSRISGGSINSAYRIGMDDGNVCFVKTNSGHLYDMFRTEARGLGLLREACRGIRIPDVRGVGVTAGNELSWLMLEYIENGSPGTSFFRNFGEYLAGLHRNSSPCFGLDHDNYIGRLEQSNTGHDSWSVFFAQERLLPQLKSAVDNGLLPSSISRNFDILIAGLDDIFPPEPPALLHGDLWGGNYLCDGNNTPVMIDPAVYYGHREMEIAFTRLFGGYDPDFYAGYHEAWPLENGHEQRVDICNLYPLLVHTNLFGSSYAGQVKAIIRRFS